MPHTRDTPCCFLQDMSRPFSFFKALLEADVLLNRGVTDIRHRMGDVYYLCLLRLRAHDLAKFLAKLQDGGFDKDWCWDRLKKAGVNDDGIPPENEDGDPVFDADHETGLVRLFPMLLDHTVEWKRCIAISHGETDKVCVKVIFDHLSSGSGKQRCYANCCGDHPRCFLWKQADSFNSRDEAALFFYTWATNCHNHATRTEHMAWQPDQSLVDANKGKFEFVERRRQNI